MGSISAAAAAPQRMALPEWRVGVPNRRIPQEKDYRIYILKWTAWQGRGYPA